MTKYLIAGALVVGLITGAVIQDWRFSSKIAKMELDHQTELQELEQAARNKQQANEKLAAELAEELVKSNSKRRTVVITKQKEVEREQSNNSAKCNFTDEWVRIYNNAGTQ